MTFIDELWYFVQAENSKSMYVKQCDGKIVRMRLDLISDQVRRQMHEAKLNRRPDLEPCNICVRQVYSSIVDVNIAIDPAFKNKFVLQVLSSDKKTPFHLAIPFIAYKPTGIINYNSPFDSNTFFSYWIAKTPYRTQAQKTMVRNIILYLGGIKSLI